MAENKILAIGAGLGLVWFLSQQGSNEGGNGGPSNVEEHTDDDGSTQGYSWTPSDDSGRFTEHVSEVVAATDDDGSIIDRTVTPIADDASDASENAKHSGEVTLY